MKLTKKQRNDQPTNLIVYTLYMVIDQFYR
jgi:hypothetical protein